MCMSVQSHYSLFLTLYQTSAINFSFGFVSKNEMKREKKKTMLRLQTSFYCLQMLNVNQVTIRSMSRYLYQLYLLMNFSEYLQGSGTNLLL